MKKILCGLLILALLLSAAPGVFAAGSASLGGPDTVRSGDTITLVFYAGGGIYGGSGNMSFDSSQLTLQRCHWRQLAGGVQRQPVFVL